MSALPFHVPAAEAPFVMLSGAAEHGRQLRVMFDTGDATPFIVIVGRRAAAAAGARPTGEAEVVIRGTAGGAPARFSPARMPSFRLGPIAFSDVSTGVSDAVDKVSDQVPVRVDAVVGQVFALSRVVSLDYRTHQVDFDAAPGPPAAALPMTIAPKRPLSLVSAMIDGRGPFSMVVDTGAVLTLLSPEAARRAGVSAAGRYVTFGGAGGTRSHGRAARARVQIGSADWPAADVVVTDILGVVAEESGAQVDGVLGADLFGHGRLVIDYPGRRLWIDRGR
ncbi:retropepsin-like aspartic protease [Phenylobacterium sp.]|uniref:retropepsin-like aspartic protease n=1 Tax=Phenylobacterium sp. TaxID=1871053 RepID=UPI0026086735|nr:retropepsin-like aspartic protease [Phenylobacterium sp.]